MAEYVILNGELIEREAAALPVNDRGFLYGDGLFETVRAYEGRVFRFADHLDRLRGSADFFGISVTHVAGSLTAGIDKLIKAHNCPEARIRITVTRGLHRGTLDLSRESVPTVLITAEPMPVIPAARYEAGIELFTSDVVLFSGNPLSRHKTLNYLPFLMARDQARKKGADEALLLDENGNVAECSTANLFMVQNRALFTTALEAAILPGITRKAVLELAGRQKLALREELFSRVALFSAAEIFITNSVQEIVPVRAVDGRVIGDGRPGPITRMLMESYRNARTIAVRHLAVV